MCEQISVDSSDKNGACSDKIKNAIREPEYQLGKRRVSDRPKVNLQVEALMKDEGKLDKRKDCNSQLSD